ncbi:MAG: hypothetical protein V7761_12055 [Amylibacter sp.]
MTYYMKTKEQLATFAANQEGAVTVDFVVLTGGVVLIAIAAATALASKVVTAVSAISV